MDIFNPLNAVTRTADTVYEYATFDWDKKSIISLAVTATAFVGVTVILAKINSKKKKNISNNTEGDTSTEDC